MEERKRNYNNGVFGASRRRRRRRQWDEKSVSALFHSLTAGMKAEEEEKIRFRCGLGKKYVPFLGFFEKLREKEKAKLENFFILGKNSNTCQENLSHLQLMRFNTRSGNSICGYRES